LPLKAINRPFSEYTKHLGDRAGHHWRRPSVRGKRLLPTLQIDANYWKSRLRDAWRVARGSVAAGSLELFGREPEAHRLYADHLTAEYFARVQAYGRVVDEWHSRPDNRDNHWLDCTVGTMVAASVCGITLSAGEAMPHTRSRPAERPSLAQLRGRNR